MSPVDTYVRPTKGILLPQKGRFVFLQKNKMPKKDIAKGVGKQ